MKKIFDPQLLKLLKGKTSFHIKEINEELPGQIPDALKKGFDIYKKNG